MPHVLERLLRLFRRSPPSAPTAPTEPVPRPLEVPAASERGLQWPAQETTRKREPLFLPGEFLIDEALAAQVRSELPARTGKSPTQSQWEMILSTGHNTVVNAGAGSGKSTTLIQRILVLHHYLGVPYEEMTVFSFTRKSTEEFRQKLVEGDTKLGGTLSAEQAKKVVRTFHSKVLEFRPRGGNGVFDFLGGDREAAEAMGPMELADPKRLAPEQQTYLRSAFENCYRSTPRFAAIVDELHLRHLRLNRLAPTGKAYEKPTLRAGAAADAQVSRSLQGIFKGTRSAKPIPLALKGFQPPISFFANDFIEELGYHVVYLPNEDSLGKRREELVGELPLPKWLKFKERVLGQYCQHKVFYARSQADLDQLLEEARFVTRADKTVPPNTLFKLKGETKELPLWQALYAAGSFVESMGLGMGAMSAAAGKLEGADVLFTRLLEPYFAELDRLLSDDELIRFSTLFARFSEKDPKSLDAVAQGTLLSMTHVFVDEFQDISPDAVGWIRGVLGALKRRGVQTSLLCVGDDYQSIYGWRGSSPHYFLRYEAEFPSEAITRVKLEENFRSGQTIIDSAERTLLGIPRAAKTEKHGLSRASEPGSVILKPTEDVAAIVEEVRALIAQFPRDKPPSLFVLGRTNRVTDAVAGELNKLARGTGARPTAMTFHKSKGLEADICVLVGDCLYVGESPFRNLAYSLAAFPGSYDEAQRHEALRLAYVALTRARQHCVWFAKPQKGGAFELLQPARKPAMGVRPKAPGSEVAKSVGP